jgi:drug/metabolite transporter (DMT)-like permease
MRAVPLTLLGSGAALGAALCFATLGPLSQLAYDRGVEPFGFVFWRAAIGAAFLSLVVAGRATRGATIPSLARLPRSSGAMLLLATAMGLGVNMAMFSALALLPVAVALLAFYTYPAMVAAAAMGTRREPVTGTRLSALGLALAGMVLVLAGQLEPAGGVPLSPLGIALGLTAAAFQTVFVLIGRDGYPEVPPDLATVVILAGSATGIVVATLLTGGFVAISGPVATPEVWLMLVIAGVIGAGIPSTLMLLAIRVIGGTRTGILMLFEPVAGTVLAAVVLAQVLAPIQVAGGALVLGAALLLQQAHEPALTGDDPSPADLVKP